MCTRATCLGLISLLSLTCAGKQLPTPGSAPAAAADDTAGEIMAALAGSHRAEKHRARDRYRHPLETLSFFGLRADMTVVELWPGNGWYTEVLAPVLAERGKLVATNTDPSKGYRKRYKELLEGKKEVFGRPSVRAIA